MAELQRIACDWCGGQSPPDSQNCSACGAPLNIKNLVSDSGWREAPRLRDMSEIHFGTSIAQTTIPTQHVGRALPAAPTPVKA